MQNMQNMHSLYVDYAKYVNYAECAKYVDYTKEVQYVESLQMMQNMYCKYVILLCLPIETCSPTLARLKAWSVRHALVIYSEQNKTKHMLFMLTFPANRINVLPDAIDTVSDVENANVLHRYRENSYDLSISRRKDKGRSGGFGTRSRGVWVRSPTRYGIGCRDDTMSDRREWKGTDFTVQAFN
jgi:hypothetical protein